MGEKRSHGQRTMSKIQLVKSALWREAGFGYRILPASEHLARGGNLLPDLKEDSKQDGI